MQTTKAADLSDRAVTLPEVVLGTADGVIALDRRNGTWQSSATYLEGKAFNTVVRQGADVVLAASVGNGLWRIDLRTGDVRRLGAGVLPDKLRAIAVSPHDANKVYVGSEPVAIFVSDDGGETWRETNGAREHWEQRRYKYPVPSVAPHIRHLLVDWEDPRYVYASLQVGGILRSEDGGNTWLEVRADDFDPDVHSIFQHPSDPQVIFAVTGGGGPVETAGDMSGYAPPLPHGRPLYRSRDRGKTWECVSPDFHRHYGIAMNAVPGPQVTFIAGVGRDAPPFWAKRDEGADAIVMASSDGGSSWKPLMDGLPPKFTTMVEAVEVDRKRGNRILIGTGGDRMREGGKPQRTSAVYVCETPGASWTRVPVDLPGISMMIAI